MRAAINIANPPFGISSRKRLSANGDFEVKITLGALAQLGERLICIQEVSGSIPLGSTNVLFAQRT
jgi:hypothetical protein